MSYLHLRIAPVGRRRWADDLVLVDLDEDWVRKRVLEPRERGEPITVKGRTLGWDQIDHVKITQTEERAEVISARLRAEREARSRASNTVAVGGPSFAWRVVDQGEDLTDQLIDGAPGIAQESVEVESALARVPSDPQQRRRVMVIFGRDREVKDALFAWLRAIDLRPQEWTELVTETGSGSPYTGEVLDRAMEVVQAVVVLLTPDDLVRLRDDLLQPGDGPEEREVRGQPRPNVLFEAGLAFGRHHDRTVMVEHGALRGLSDLTGRHTVRLARGVQALHDLAQRLTKAGCETNLSGEDWLDFSDFPPSVGSEGKTPTLKEPASEGDSLARLVAEILEEALGHAPAQDIPAGIAERLRSLEGPTGGEDLVDGLPGRRLPIEVIKSLTFELAEHGVLRRNPDERVRGYVLGVLP